MFNLSKKDTAQVIFAGDSITARGCFNEFFENENVLNRGIGSDTTEGLYNRIEQIIDYKPESVFIMIGINDIAREIDPMDSVKYLNASCERIREKLPYTNIYIQSILPTNDEEWTEDIQNLNSLYKEMCEKNGYFYIDLYPEYFVDGNQNMNLFCDGTHLTGDGYKIWIESVKEYVEQ